MHLLDNILVKLIGKTIYDSYSCGFKTFGQFCKAMDGLKENEFLVFKRTHTKSPNIVDCVFRYIAEDHPGFKMFSPLVWRENKRRYDPNYIIKNRERKKREKLEKQMKEEKKKRKKEERSIDDIEFIRG